MMSSKVLERNIFCTTLNAGGASLSELLHYNYRDNAKGGKMIDVNILSSWIPDKKHYDVYCFALQNCKDVSEEEVSLLEAFLSTSHPLNEKYILVAKESLRTWNILRPRPMIMIIARASVTITDLVHSSKLLNQGSNTGGIGVEFRMDGQHYCIVCAHFTSKVQKIKEREKDFSAIYSKIIDDNYLRRSARRGKGFTFDHIIFMGDLNYRVQLPGHEEECEDQFEEACGLILEQDWDSLIAADQLRQQLKSNPRLFPGFTEIEHRWPPTSCMDRKRNDYVPKISGGKPSYETPSYTDRILFRTCGRFVLVGDTYSPASNFLGSDHRPVNATFHTRDTQRPQTIVIDTGTDIPTSPGFEFDVDEDSLPYPHDFDCSAINGGAHYGRWKKHQSDTIDSLLTETQRGTNRDRCCSECVVM